MASAVGSSDGGVARDASRSGKGRLGYGLTLTGHGVIRNIGYGP